MPLPITENLMLHLDASVLELDDGDPVVPWNDLSSSGLVLVNEGFASNPPTFRLPSLNGLGGVEFPARNSGLGDSTSVSLSAPRTTYFVAKMPPSNTDWRYIHPQGAGFLIVKSPADQWIFGYNGGGGQWIGWTDSEICGTDAMVTFVHQMTNAEVRVNGEQTAIGNLGENPSITTINFGNTGGSAGDGLVSFVMYEFIMFSGVHNSGQIETMEDYLFDKWFVEGEPDPDPEPGVAGCFLGSVW